MEIDPHSKEPSYAQVARQLREQIMSGELGPRDQLPSLKRLVQETGLAVGTVQHAIRVLEAEGIVYTVSGAGRSSCRTSGRSADSTDTTRAARPWLSRALRVAHVQAMLAAFDDAARGFLPGTVSSGSTLGAVLPSAGRERGDSPGMSAASAT